MAVISFDFSSQATFDADEENGILFGIGRQQVKSFAQLL